MKRINWISAAATLAIAAFAIPASAATWNLERNVTAVEVTDDTNNGGTNKMLLIFLSSAGTYCGTSQSIITINQTESTLWEHWLRQAEAAALSGRKLKIYSSNASGTCKAFSIILKE
jgi:hypothetical protein